MDADTVQAESVHSVFTAHEGVTFERLYGGAVRIALWGHVAVLDDAMWASAVCSVSDRGETDYRWYQARAFHTRGETAKWLVMVGDPLRHLLRHVLDGLALGLLRGPDGSLVRKRPDGSFEHLGPDDTGWYVITAPPLID